MKKIRISAKNYERAVEEGLKELNATQEEVDIKIIDQGGLFKKAIVEITLDRDVEEKRLAEEKKTMQEKVEKENASTQKEKQEEKKEIKEEKKEEKTEKKECSCSKEKNKNCPVEIGTNFLTGLFERMNISAQISTVEQESGITFNASGENVSNLIGKRGETLNAIQDILSNVLKNAGFRETKFFFDVENYKNRREVSLTNLAERMASKALKINKPIKLERMSAYERKIIHSYLQNVEGVTTKSEGEEPNRYLVIIPTKNND